MTNDIMPPDLSKEDDNPDKLMAWADHLAELRTCLLKIFLFFCFAFALIYPFAGKILDFLLVPLASAMRQTGGSQRVIFTGLAEGFVTHLKLSGFGAAVLTFPFCAFQIWRYAAPGLYPRERDFIRPFFWLSPLLFIAGGVFVFYAMMPLAFRFLLGFQQLASSAEYVPVVLEARLAEYLSFMISLILAFGICFQLPLVLVILARLGFVTVQDLITARRYAIVLIFIIAAIATPPDIISQFGLAVPLLILYEGAIWFIRRVENKVN